MTRIMNKGGYILFKEKYVFKKRNVTNLKESFFLVNQGYFVKFET